MTGPENSVLGVRTDIIIEKLKNHMPVRFELAPGPTVLCGACFTLDTDTRRVTDAVQIRRVYGA